jgi:hypothetical protein
MVGIEALWQTGESWLRPGGKGGFDENPLYAETVLYSDLSNV